MTYYGTCDLLREIDPSQGSSLLEMENVPLADNPTTMIVQPQADLLARLRTLEITARRDVEGLLTGSHPSRQFGFAVEFAQHREYTPGDDIRHIDWKVYGRKERYYLKQYELETDLALWLLVDASESMRYGSGTTCKYELAARAAAALGYLVLRQTDALGFIRFDSQIRKTLRAVASPTQWKDVLSILSEGTTTEVSQVGACLDEAARRIQRRGIICIFSDLFDEPSAIAAALKHLRYRRHEVVVFHTLDCAEIEFPFRQTTLFQGLEQWPELLTDPVSVREGYLAEFNAFREEVQNACRQYEAEYVELRTDADLGRVLAEFLANRNGRG